MYSYEHPANLKSVAKLRYLRYFTGVYYPFRAISAIKTSVLVRCVPKKRRIVHVEDHFPPTHDEINCYPQYAVATVYPPNIANGPKQKPCYFQIFYQSDSKLPDNKYASTKWNAQWKGSVLILALKKRKIAEDEDWAPKGLENCDVARWVDAYDDWLDDVIKGLIDATEVDEEGVRSSPRYFSVRILS